MATEPTSENILCISIISGGTVRTDTIASLIESLNQIKIEKYLYMPVGGYAALNRNMAAKQALENGATHLMFVDNDMVFPGDGINKLLAHNKDIVLGSYNARGAIDVQNNVIKVASTLKIGKKGDYKEVDPQTLPKDDIFEVAGGGTGYMLIKTSVFKKLPYPWFIASEENREWTTEDIYFCELARDHGIRIWCDPTIKIGHIGTYTY